MSRRARHRQPEPFPAGQRTCTLPKATPSGRPVADAILPGTMQQAAELARRVAPTTAFVLVTGESGTGKEIISRIVHGSSNRAARPMVCVNCAALPETLIESELFGHRRGAFTGADQDRTGSFELSSGGTLLLDEVSEIAPGLQAKLLRVLERREIQRIGSGELIPLDLRVVATSNRNLEAEVDAGRFRPDLFHRLNMIRIHLPPLRERPQDIRLLASHFAGNSRDYSDDKICRIDAAAMRRLEQYHWPGNVRELRNVVLRACILSDGPVLGPECFGDFDRDSGSCGDCQPDLSGLTLDQLELLAIRQALARFNGNRVAAARALGITPRTIFNKLRERPASDDSGRPAVIPFPRSA